MTRNADEPVPTVEVSRYGKLPEIHHIFKSDPQSPPIVITLAFVAMVLATLPVLGGVVSSTLYFSFQYVSDTAPVALPWRQRQPPAYCLEVGSYPSHCVPWLPPLHRGHLLPVL